MMRAEVRDIRWERVWLLAAVRVTGTTEESGDAVMFALASESGKRYFPFRAEPSDTAQAEAERAERKPEPDEPADGLWHLRMNITNPGDERCLAADRYLLEVRCGGKVCHAAAPENCAAAGRRFLYGDGSEAYQVRAGRDSRGRLVLRTGITAADGTEAKPAELSLRQKIMRRSLTALYHIRRNAGPHALPHRKKRILYFSEQNEEPGTNLTALRRRLEERGLADKYREQESCRITATSRHLGLVSWVRTILRLADADYIFMDDHAPVLNWLVLDRSTIVTQLWHAGIGFKASGYSRWGHVGSPAPFSCHRQYTYGITGSSKTRDVFAEIWGLNTGRVLPAGLPRMDAFLDESERERRKKEVLERYPCCRGRKVILFAPTYRGKSRRDAHYPFDRIDFRALKDVCGSDRAVLFRMHPWVKEPVPIPEDCRDIFADASDTPDIGTLYCASDLLITDYSSDIYEYSLLSRPMLFYAFDEREYAAERGFHLDYEAAAPGRVCRTFPDLLEALGNGCFEEEKVRAYRERNFDHPDSRAADRIIDWVLLGKMPGKLRRELDAENEFKRRIKR